MGEGKIGLVMDVLGEEDYLMCLIRSLSFGFLSGEYWFFELVF